MCIAAWLWLGHPEHPLILVHNRDELHDRPTSPVGWWPIKKEKEVMEGEDDQKNMILGGRDIQGGGTWMGCTEEGRVAFLTNVMDPDVIPDAQTRGDLPVRFLKSSKTPMEYAEEVAREGELYNGFNLVVADLVANQMVYVTNRNRNNNNKVQVVSPGLHVLTNASLDTPWHKARRLGQSLEKVLLGGYGERREKVLAGELVDGLLMDTAKAAVDELPNTGCDTDWEHGLSSVFVDIETHMGRYGTRSQAALSVEWGGAASYYERYLETGKWKEHTLCYHIRPPPSAAVGDARICLAGITASADGAEIRAGV